MHAFYYARVLEIETPRWSTIQARQIGIEPPDTVPATVKERAWSSPIWYTPGADAKKKATPGLTVADLTGKGAKALTDDQLKSLLVGKSMWFSNTVTGETFKMFFDSDGNSLILHVGERADVPGVTGDLVSNGYLTTPTPYSIRNGRVTMMLSNTPIDVAVYSTGDKHYAARSNEFGYANYELLAKGPSDLVTLPKSDFDKADQASFLHSKDQE